MGDIFLDALIDSLKVFGFCLIIYFIFSFFEEKLCKVLDKHTKLGPLFGSLVGVVPQCGVSVVGSDLYIKRHISMGTLVAIFIACSDEALPILFSNFDKWYVGFILIGIKIIYGFIIGFLVDLFYTKSKKNVETHLESCDHHDEKVDIGCCHHKINDEHESKWHEHLIHPLIHSLKIFLYVFIINILFGLLIYYVGEDNISNFLTTNRYLTPLFSLLIGLIPNCASSVLLSNLYVLGNLPFGALLCGLCVNAGLGLLYLFKEKTILKESFIILGILIVASLIIGYAFIFISI